MAERYPHGSLDNAKSDVDADDNTEAEADDAGDGDAPKQNARPPDKRPVGYRSPPEHTRFKPGQSGNPRGRPRGARGLRTELKAELGEQVTITVDGKQQRVSKLRLTIKALAAKAAQGNVAAADKLLSLVIAAEGFEDQRAVKPPLSDAEQQIVERMTRFVDTPDPAPDLSGNESDRSLTDDVPGNAGPDINNGEA